MAPRRYYSEMWYICLYETFSYWTKQPEAEEPEKIKMKTGYNYQNQGFPDSEHLSSRILLCLISLKVMTFWQEGF